MKENLSTWATPLLSWMVSHGIRILVIFIAAYFFHKFIHRFIERAVRVFVKPESHSSQDAEIKREDTLIRIFSAALNVAMITLVALMVLQELGVKIGPLLAGAGIIGLAFGFGGQYIIRDLITGLFIILENQYRIGDVVTLNDTSGLVEDISLRRSMLRDLDGTVHHIPHGEIRKVSNLSKNFSRVNINVGVAYNTDIDHLIEVVNRVGNQLAGDPEWKELIIKPPLFVRVDALADSAIIVKIVGDTQPLKQWAVSGELRKRILKTFKNEGIEIPFPQLVLHQNPIKQEPSKTMEKNL